MRLNKTKHRVYTYYIDTSCTLKPKTVLRSWKETPRHRAKFQYYLDTGDRPGWRRDTSLFVPTNHKEVVETTKETVEKMYKITI